MPDNSFPPPEALPPDLPPSPEKPQGKLYRLSGVGISTFFGSPLAGGILLAANARRMGRPSAARRDLLILGLLTLVMISVAFASWFYPDSAPLKFFLHVGGIAGLGATIVYARRVQGGDIDRHVASGGVVESNWRAAGLGVLMLAAILLLIFAVGFALVYSGAANMDNDGNLVQSLPAPTEVTLSPGWVVVKNDKEDDYTGYDIKRFRHGTQVATFQIQIGGKDDMSLKEAFEQYMLQIDLPSASDDTPEIKELQINGRPALFTDGVYDVHGVKVFQQRVMTLSDKRFCAIEYTAREENFPVYKAEVQAMRDSLKCP